MRIIYETKFGVIVAVVVLLILCIVLLPYGICKEGWKETRADVLNAYEEVLEMWNERKWTFKKKKSFDNSNN